MISEREISVELNGVTNFVSVYVLYHLDKVYQDEPTGDNPVVVDGVKYLDKDITEMFSELQLQDFAGDIYSEIYEQ